MLSDFSLTHVTLRFHAMLPAVIYAFISNGVPRIRAARRMSGCALLIQA